MDAEKPQSFYDRAKASRNEKIDKYNLKTDSEKFNRLLNEGRMLLQEELDQLQLSRTPQQFGQRLDLVLNKVAALFDDEYGSKARKALFERILDKARHEIVDALPESEKSGRMIKLQEASTSWESLAEAGAWLAGEFHVSPDDFARIRDEKIKEARFFFRSLADS